eukprot:TCALIF_01421-PA protein Name:"Similar to Tret1 Facilitated trehalose transporter Tret1 (Aedes aegypti)" AED:0.20 eAED:0.20 QI:0/0/0/0.5/1/1/4/0/494
MNNREEPLVCLSNLNEVDELDQTEEPIVDKAEDDLFCPPLSSRLAKSNEKSCPAQPAPNYRLYAVYCVELIPAFVAGTQLTYGTIALPAHQLDHSFIKLDIEIGSWFGLMALHVAWSAHFLLVGRILCGFGSGLGLPTSYLFLHESAIPRHRSALAAWNIFSLNCGNLFSLVLGWVVPYPWMPFTCAVPCLIFCLCIFKVPESPVFLLERRKEPQAKENLINLWRDKEIALLEMACLKAHLATHLSHDSWVVSLGKRLTWHNFKYMSMVCVLMLIQSFSGSDTVYNYIILIAQMAHFSMNENLISVLHQCGFNLGFIVAPFLVKHTRRKTHFLYASIGITIASLLLALGMSHHDLGERFPEHSFLLFQFLPAISICLYSFFYGCGIGSVPYTMMGELLPDAIRNMGNSLAMLFRYGSVFILLKQFPAMTSTMGLNGLFLFHACCCAMGAIFVQFLVPETKPIDTLNDSIEGCPAPKTIHHQESVKTMEIDLDEL